MAPRGTHKVTDRAEAISLLQKLLVKFPKVRRVAMFGSFARGEQTEDSDVDLVLDIKRPAHLGEVLDVKDALTDAFGREVDLLTSLDGCPPYLIDQIRRDGAVVYAAEAVLDGLAPAAELQEG